MQITPKQVRRISDQFGQASQESQQMVSRLQNTMNGLAPDWEGMTKERFFQSYEQWRTSMTQFVQMLQQIGQELDNIATRFEQADSTGR